MTSSSRARILSLVAAIAAASLTTASLPRIAYAQASAEELAQARLLFNKGRELRDKGDVRGALEKFKAAHALGSTPLTGYELGKTHQQLGELVEAREAFLSVVRLPVQKDESKNSANARKESENLADELSKKIPTVHVILTGLAAGATASVEIDGAPIPSGALGEPRPVNPGKHTIVATVQGAPGDKREEFEIKESENRDITLDVTALKPPPPPVEKKVEQPVAQPGAETRSLSPLVWIGFGVGAAGLIAGSVTGVMSLSKASSVKDQCDGNTCPRSVQDDLDSSKSLATVSTIGFAVGIAGVGVGVVGLLLSGSSSTEKAPEKSASKPHVTPWVGLGSIGLSGSF